MESFDRESFTISGKIVNKKEKEFLAKNDCRWCSKCKKAKTLNEFWASQYGCIECNQQVKKKWEQDNPDYFAQYRSNNKDRQQKAHRSWFERNKEKKNEQNRQWYENNKDKTRERNSRNRERYKTLPEFKLRKALRQRVYSFLLGSKSERTMDLIGCCLEDLKQYLENKFTIGMSWDNYGNPNGNHSECWHIDHIIPCSSFDLSDPEQQKICFHYTNLQPLWGIDNIKKSNKT
jgi:hypothetical protein